MTKISKYQCLAIFALALTSYEQKQQKVANGSYFVDGTIKDTINKKVKSLNGVTVSSMDVKLFENDSIVADTYSTGKSINECLTMTTLDGDTINIMGFAGMFAGFGYQIALTQRHLHCKALCQIRCRNL